MNKCKYYLNWEYWLCNTFFSIPQIQSSFSPRLDRLACLSVPFQCGRTSYMWSTWYQAWTVTWLGQQLSTYIQLIWGFLLITLQSIFFKLIWYSLTFTIDHQPLASPWFQVELVHSSVPILLVTFSTPIVSWFFRWMLSPTSAVQSFPCCCQNTVDSKLFDANLIK
jgi:hypothetical protein